MDVHKFMCKVSDDFIVMRLMDVNFKWICVHIDP